VNLLAKSLRARLEAAATASGLLDARVEWKHNTKGEFVIAIITTDDRLRADKIPGARGRNV
jgi:hypothetical protein